MSDGRWAYCDTFSKNKMHYFVDKKYAFNDNDYSAPICKGTRFVHKMLIQHPPNECEVTPCKMCAKILNSLSEKVQ